MYTEYSAPLRMRLALHVWCFTTPPPRITLQSHSKLEFEGHERYGHCRNLHAGTVSSHSDIVDLLDIVHNVHAELGALVGVKVHHIAERAVGQRGTKHRDVVLVGPVVHRVLVVDLLAEAVDHGGGSPAGAVGHLLVGHGVQDGVHPVFKEAVILVGHNEVAEPVDALSAQLSAVQLEVAHVSGSQALDKVLLNAASSGHNRLHQIVLHKELDGLSHAGGDQVAGVRQEDGAFGVLAILRVLELVGISLLDGAVA